MLSKKVVLGTVFSLALGVIGGFGYQSFFDSTSSVDAESTSLKSISKGMDKPDVALKNVSFKDKVKTPKNLPFDSSLSEVVELGEVTEFGNTEQYHYYYIDKKTEGFVELQVTDANVVPEYDTVAGFKIKETKLSNGISASYMDNGVYQFLYWQQDDLSYTLVAEKSKNDKSKKFNSKELENIAESIR